MTPQKGLRHNHPILFGLFILAGIFLLFCGGISLLISSASRHDRGEIFGQKEGLGIINLQGLIVSPEETLRDLLEFRTNDNVKAIVLRIESPGGAVGASQEIFQEVKRINKLKPVVASMGSVAASGGYYAALGAERIMANPGTITGSIGVIIKFANLQELFEKIGYRSEVIKSGRLKDIGSPNRPLSEEERGLIQGLIDNVHEQFVRAVAESRLLPIEQVRGLADGRIFSGEQAKEAGLIDGLGNFTDAALLAGELGGLDTTEMPHLIYPKRDEFPFISRFLRGAEGQAILNRYLFQVPGLAYEWTLAQ